MWRTELENPETELNMSELDCLPRLDSEGSISYFSSLNSKVT